MATITDWDTVKKLIDNNGHYMDDPQIYRVTEYTNNFGGGKCWGIDYTEEWLYEPSEYVRNPKVIWEKPGLKTQAQARIVFWTEHEFGGEGRIRIWTDKDSRYGTFQIISQDEFKEVERQCKEHGIELIYIE